MIKRITLALALTSCSPLPVLSAGGETWSGAGPNACHGRCNQAWAETLLTDDELSQLRRAQASQAEPSSIYIQDGDVFDLMTYFSNGEAKGHRSTTVAELPAPERAVGWRMNGWSFVKIDVCSNWAIVRDAPIGQVIRLISPGVFRGEARQSPRSGSGYSFNGSSSSYSGGSGSNLVTTDIVALEETNISEITFVDASVDISSSTSVTNIFKNRNRPNPKPETPDPAHVSLPASFWLAILFLGSLGLVYFWSKFR